MLNLARIIVCLSSSLFLLGCVNTNKSIERKSYFPWENETGYSQVVKHGNTLYVSGITSEKTTFDGQIDDIYTNIKKMLADYGVGMDAIVKEVIFTTDIEGLRAAIATRKAHFNGKYPSSTWVEVKGLWSKSHLLEVEIVAALP
ncbi:MULTISPECIES: Rid family hydrolase [Alteromonadaceae]|uniref:RidA family protein n=1 Tax=Alteromonadaceae TaxID=72275 RepID=UPI0031029DC1